MNLNQMYDKITGPCVRQIAFKGAPKNALYLTFDDGPDPVCTMKVLDLLKIFQVKATFFVVALKAEAHPEIMSAILKDGHSIGDHSLDHDTKNYFKGETELSAWLENSSAKLNSLNLSSIGFRSPVGIKTPGLNKVLATKRAPLILWNLRFYDTARGLSREAVDVKLKDASAGDIILLHDTHPRIRQDSFLDALEHLIVQSQQKGFTFLPLDAKLVQNSFTEKYETP